MDNKASANDRYSALSGSCKVNLIALRIKWAQHFWALLKFVYTAASSLTTGKHVLFPLSQRQLVGRGEPSVAERLAFLLPRLAASGLSLFLGLHRLVRLARHLLLRPRRPIA